MKKRLLSGFLVAVMLCQSLVTFASNSNYNDISGHWAENSITKWSDDKVIQGSNNQFRPNDNITRGELAVILDRIMGYENKAKNNFSDLDQNFYTDAVLKANAADIIMGSGNKVRPNDAITREEASVMIARALHFDLDTSKNTNFSDDSKISSWAKPAVSVLSSKGIVNGSNNMFLPKNPITRAEVVKILDNAINLFANEKKTYSEDVDGNVVINKGSAKLKDMTIDGDLIIAEGVLDGEVYLDDVIIEGNVIVKGGGVNSIMFNNVTVKGGVVVSRDGDTVRIVASGNTQISLIEVDGNVKIVATDLDGGIIGEVVINSGDKIELDGDFGTIISNVSNVEISISEDSNVDNIIMNEGGSINGEDISAGTNVEEIPDVKPDGGGSSGGGSGDRPTPPPVIGESTETLKYTLCLQN